jgi:hypothetical protein
MTATWWRTSSWGKRIEPVTIERLTDSSVWINGRRHLIKSAYDNYFPEWEDAHRHLLGKAEARLEQVKRDLTFCQCTVDELKALKKP